MPPRPSQFDQFLTQLDKTYKATIAPPPPEGGKHDVISSGSLLVDYMMYWGGWQRRMIHELVGPPDSAKTLLMILSAACAQALGDDARVAYVDMERTFDDDWAEANGLDLSKDKWTHRYPRDSEEAADLARKFCESGFYPMVILDSIGGMESRKALVKDAVDELPGRNAQVITRMVKQLSAAAFENNVAVILVNQLRATIGQMGGDKSAGPKAMQHLTTTRVQMAAVGGSEGVVKMTFDADIGDEPLSQQFRARVTRSKIYPRGRTAEFWVNNRPTDEYGPAGLNRADEYVSLGVRRINGRDPAIIQKGSWFTLPCGDQMQGRGEVAKRLMKDDDERARVRELIFAEETE